MYIIHIAAKLLYVSNFPVIYSTVQLQINLLEDDYILSIVCVHMYARIGQSWKTCRNILFS